MSEPISDADLEELREFAHCHNGEFPITGQRIMRALDEIKRLRTIIGEPETSTPSPWVAEPPSPEIRFPKLRADAMLPTRGSEGAAGLDLYAVNRHVVCPGDIVVVPLGIASELPCGTFASIRGRSGLGARGIDVHSGVIDPDYRGEWKVVLANHGLEPVEFKPGDRVAQAIIQRYERPTLVQVDRLGETARGSGGFGSTGK